MRPLRTADLARAVGIHPNTVRLYEQWGILPPVPRSPKGYRQFTERHLDQLRLARLGFRCTWLGGQVRQKTLDLIHVSAGGDLEGALELAHEVVALIDAEWAEAEAAAAYLQRWAEGQSPASPIDPLWIGPAARLVGSTPDALRNWERNGLIRVPRDPHNRYRLYGAAEIGRLRVIRLLLRSGYSTMAVLRMLLRLDQGHTADLRQVLDTPRPDEDVLYATDRWLSTLNELQQAAGQMVVLLEEMVAKQTADSFDSP